MGTHEVRLWPDPVLSQPCALVEGDASALIADLFDTMYEAYGRGLAAPQIGVLKRAFVVDVTWKEGPRDPRAFVNPQIVEVSDETVVMTEQCLSIPDRPMEVSRPAWVRLKWQDVDGALHEDRFDGVLARCIQHEFDHLNGVVIFDHQPEAPHDT